MKPNSWARTLLRTSVCLAGLLSAATSFGAKADVRQVPARVLDQAKTLCDNCFFGPSYYYFCFAVDDKILVGYQRVSVLNWWDPSKNYLTKVRHGWMPWSPSDTTIPISYDDKHIWVTRPDGKRVRLIQSPSYDGFTNNQACRVRVRKRERLAP